MGWSIRDRTFVLDETKAAIDTDARAIALVFSRARNWRRVGDTEGAPIWVTPQERAVRRERADLVERDGMQVLVDYTHTGLYGTRTAPEMRSRVDAMMTRGCGPSAEPRS